MIFRKLFTCLIIRYTSGGNTSFTFRYGRTTAKSCEYEGSNRLPAATAGLADSKRVFQKQMGLTIRAMVALFGVRKLRKQRDPDCNLRGGVSTRVT